MESEEPVNANKAAQAQYIENQYIKVFGIIKSLQNQKNVQAFKIMPLKELNEVTHHILDCMSAVIYYASKSGCGDNLDIAMAGGGNTKFPGGMNIGGEINSTSGLTGTHQQVRK